jgi:hypothetical protein
MTHPAPPGPDATPTRDDLWSRNRLALALLDQRGASTETAVLVQRVLTGETIESLLGGVA